MALIDNILFYYNFNDNAANTTVIDSVGTQNGTASTNTSNLSVATGPFNAAFDLDGISEFIDITGITSSSGDYTFSMWLNPDDFVTVSNFLDFQSGRIVLEGQVTTGNIRMFDGAFRDWVNVNAKLVAGVYSFYVFKFDSGAGTCELLIDDVSMGTVSYTTRNLGGTSTIGSNFGGNFPFDGKMSGIGGWERVLTSQESTDLYNSGNGLAYPFITTIFKELNESSEATDTLTIKRTVKRTLTESAIVSDTIILPKLEISKSIDFNNGLITSATISITSISKPKSFCLSADGINFENVNLIDNLNGTFSAVHTFTQTGTDLRWRLLDSNNEIININLSNYH